MDTPTQKPKSVKSIKKSKWKFIIGSTSDIEKESTSNDTLSTNEPVDKSADEETAVPVEENVSSDEDMYLDTTISTYPSLDENQAKYYL